jgi:adenine-specific DNA-methyltransferase
MLALQELTVARNNRISKVNTSHKEKFAQYLTPIKIGRFMAQLCEEYWEKSDNVSVLDPDAGSGILSCYLIDELYKKNHAINLSLDAWKIDDTIISELFHTYEKLNNTCFKLMNPPYKIINSNSIYRNSLREVGIETVNTYSAFMALAIMLLADNGILAAIIFRSFFNGLYFLPFRIFRLFINNITV